MKIFMVTSVLLVTSASCQLEEQPQGDLKGWGKSNQQKATEATETDMEERSRDCFGKVFLGKETDIEPSSDHRLSVNDRDSRTYKSSATSGRVVVEGVDYWGEKFGKVDINRIEACECLQKRKIRIGTTNTGKTAESAKELQFQFGNKHGDGKFYTVAVDEAGEKSEIKIESVADDVPDDGAYDETAGTADPPQHQYCKLKITITPANKEKNITVLSLKKQYGNVEVNEIPQQQ